MKLTDEQAEKLGKLVINLLELKKTNLGRYDTTWGTKTELGLGLTILRLVNEVKQVEPNEN